MSAETAALQQQVARLVVENEQLQARLKTAATVRGETITRAVRSRLDRAERKYQTRVMELEAQLLRRNQTINALRMQLNERNL